MTFSTMDQVKERCIDLLTAGVASRCEHSSPFENLILDMPCRDRADVLAMTSGMLAGLIVEIAEERGADPFDLIATLGSFGDGGVKALTLWQPWASLVALGVKTIETRSWSTDYRGPLWIHAGMRRFGMSSDTAEFVRSWPLEVYRQVPRQHADAEMCDNYPLGAVVATCTLADVVPMVDECDFAGQHLVVFPDRLALHAGFVQQDVSDQRPYGDFSPGRFAYLLADAAPVDPPIPARGRQKLWEWSA